MTIYRETTIHSYLGLSTDDKPETGVPVGSRYYAFDTQDSYVWDGADWWEQ